MNERDRHVGLIVFGVLLIAAGCVCALLVPLLLIAQAQLAGAAGMPAYRTMAPSLTLYGGVAVAFVWLGIGSVLARRWSRPLILVVAWLWIALGLVTLAFLAVVLPAMLAAAPVDSSVPPSAEKVVVAVTLGILALVMVGLPALMILFYRRPDVQATCEARDPVSRWTDKTPLPVLGLSLALAIGAVGALPAIVAYRGVVPFFGVLLSGTPGALVYLALAGSFGYAAWATYRLRPSGWWTAVVAPAVMAISTIVTFTRVDFMEMYRLMGLPAEGMLGTAGTNAYARSSMWLIGLVTLAGVGYMVSVRKHWKQ